ncbi:Anti-sigma factor RsrA [Corynebacterium capitovis DSM 44611]|uniref:mycothiol system anti-sigma-R factor n=1 Tax=Corynebacterium capitovis TaxID=131081 RepID=UPI00035C2188|nr:mycothiol system anti-sigma-R factor [Corynebacterium capitovis]WKD57049.1 Anti-sigma factor RsrA [Corynebacterium capitovis DSM 44611]
MGTGETPGGMPGCPDCHDAQELMCELLDSHTSPERAAEIRAVIAACPACFERFRSEQEVRGIVRRCCGEAQAPEPLRQRIIASITTVTRVTLTELRYGQ